MHRGHSLNGDSHQRPNVGTISLQIGWPYWGRGGGGEEGGLLYFKCGVRIRKPKMFQFTEDIGWCTGKCQMSESNSTT